MRRGNFIVFEGLNGSGKDTQFFILDRYIYTKDRDNTVFLTKEPNSFDENGRKAREFLNSSINPYEKGRIVAKYFAKNRKFHNEIILRNLEQGTDVLCNRYYYSNFAYQGAQGVDLDYLFELNRDLLKPDLTFILDTPPLVAAERKNKSKDLKGRVFDSNIEFNQKVYELYMSFGDILPSEIGDNSVVYVDGLKSIEDLSKNIIRIYEERLG